MSTFKTRQELSVLLFRLDKETTGNLLWKAIDEYFYISIFFYIRPFQISKGHRECTGRLGK